MYSMPSRPSRHRVALWRELHRLNAVNLGHATWGVPHTELGPPDLSTLYAVVAEAGGTASSGEVGDRGALDVDLGCRLVRACEALWDGFFNRLVRCEFDGHDRPELDRDTDLLADLRAEFAVLAAQDVVMSDALGRAARALDAYRADAIAGGPALEISSEERATRHRVQRSGPGVALVDGTVRFIATITPLPSLAWEASFAEFETAIYRPDPTRPPVFSGVVVLTGAPAFIQEHVEAGQSRLRRFEQSLV
jgi:hypothetical protein